MNKLVKQVYKGYIECAMWIEDLQDVPYSVLKESLSDCKEFISNITDSELAVWLDNYSESRLGYDLYLTRNGHGAGFWEYDDIGGVGDQLTYLAENMGSDDNYLILANYEDE